MPPELYHHRIAGVMLLWLLLLSCWLGSCLCLACRDKCATIDIRYPFGVDPGCGDPGHQLHCNDTSLSLPSVPSVTVNDIDYDKKTITLNTTLFFLNKPPASSGCVFPVADGNFKDGYDFKNDTVILCLPGSAVPGSEFPDQFPVPGGCLLEKEDAVPQPGQTCYKYKKEEKGPDSYAGPSGYWQSLSYGVVTWYPVSSIPNGEQQCESCGGTCGYQVSDPTRFECLDPGKKKKNPGAIIGGVSGAGAAVLVAALAFIYCVRKRGKKSDALATSSNTQFLTSSNSSTPTPKPQMRSDSYKYSSSSFSNSFGNGSSTRFTLDELQEATDNFSDAKRLGDGGFGTVYKGRLRDGRIVAVKKLNPWNAHGKSQFDNEVTILSQVKHPHLVQLFGCCLEGRELLLVYEFVANGTLSDHLHGFDGRSSSFCCSPTACCFLGWESRLTIAAQTAEALAFLHTDVSPPIFHRDVKSTNILVDEKWNAKVGDFGLSRLVPSLDLTHVSTAPQGTPGYLDPDYHQSYQLTDKSDVYSLGVVLMEVVSAMRAVDMSRGRKEINLAAMSVARIQENRMDSLLDPRLGDPRDQQLWCQVRRVTELGFRCLAVEKDDRPTMREVAEELRQVLDEAVARRSVKMPEESPVSVVQVKWPSNSTSPNLSTDSIT